MDQPTNQDTSANAMAIGNPFEVPVGIPEGRDFVLTSTDFSRVVMQSNTLPSLVPLEQGAIIDCSAPEPTVIQMGVRPEDAVNYITRDEKRRSNIQFENIMDAVPEGVFTGMSFSIFNDEEIKKISVVEVTKNGSANDLNLFNTVNDPRFCVI